MASKYRGTAKELRALDGFVSLVRAAQSVQSRVVRTLADSDLSVSQFGVLEALFHLGELSQRELAEKLLVSKGNITFVIDNLEKRNLVKRVRSEVDRRSIHIHLTKAGRGIISRIFPDHVQQIVSEFEILTSSEQVELKRLCKKLGMQTE